MLRRPTNDTTATAATCYTDLNLFLNSLTFKNRVIRLTYVR